MTKYRVEVDRETCDGFGACVELCSEYFYLSEEDGKSKIRGGDEVMEDDQNVLDVLEVDELGCLRAAEKACPFDAIKVEEL